VDHLVERDRVGAVAVQRELLPGMKFM
jgi:hypothetical protein